MKFQAIASRTYLSCIDHALSIGNRHIVFDARLAFVGTQLGYLLFFGVKDKNDARINIIV